jgi:chromosomal replication initiator protein
MSDVWQQVLEVLKEKVPMSQFETWLRPIKFHKVQDGVLTLEVPDEFFARWVTDNYLDLIKDAMWDTSRSHVNARFLISNAYSDKQNDEPSASGEHGSVSQAVDGGNRLVPWFTFETFVTGPSNYVAHSACEMVASNPAKVYNPIFIYGGLGVGKTHLVQGIAHRVMERMPQMKVNYMTAEQFVNEVMNALKCERLEAFRYSYRGRCDILIVDDIQYLAGKDFAQEELYHTFNYLYNAQKQIVLTGDEVPKAIPRVSERLRSRFSSGLIVDIAPPDFELRKNILKAKAQREGVILPDDVACFLAERFSDSIREMQGAYNRVVAHSLIRRIPLTNDLAVHVCESIFALSTQKVTKENILKATADYFKVEVSDLTSGKRNRGVSTPRHVAMYLLKKHLGLSLQAIGDTFGGRKHPTIISAIKHVEQVKTSEPAIERAIKDIESQLGTA